MSIVAVQIGEIANPRKNSASVKPVMPISRSSTRMAGNSEATAMMIAGGYQQRARDLQASGAAQQMVGDNAAEQLGDHRAQQREGIEQQ